MTYRYLCAIGLTVHSCHTDLGITKSDHSQHDHSARASYYVLLELEPLQFSATSALEGIKGLVIALGYSTVIEQTL
jgi:hypothetical protein